MVAQGVVDDISITSGHLEWASITSFPTLDQCNQCEYFAMVSMAKATGVTEPQAVYSGETDIDDTALHAVLFQHQC